MRDRIFLTKNDFRMLREFVQRPPAGRSGDFAYLDALEEELDRAEIVDEEALPSDIVTMNSEVRLRDLDSGEESVYTLIFPTQARGRNTVSVLAPIGTALLGYRAGDVVEWRVPKGVRRFEILDVRQPAVQ